MLQAIPTFFVPLSAGKSNWFCFEGSSPVFSDIQARFPILLLSATSLLNLLT